MIGTGKLQMKISKSGKATSSEKKKMVAGPRNPLSDLNTISIPPIQPSINAQRRGCFPFIRPNSSSSSKEIFVPRSKSQPRTPKSAPPNSKTLSSIAKPTSFPKKPTQKPFFENPTNPKAPDPLHKWNELRPGSKGLAGGKTSRQEPIFKPADSEVKEDKQLSTTPRSNPTPPIQASISPEIPSSLPTVPPPICFAAGHVMAGVQDRRKCRPRGILTIGQTQSHVSLISSSSPPPCKEASVCWFSSPLKIGNGSVAKFEGQTTPSSCTGGLKTPTSGSSISPFSAIVQRAEASSGLHVLRPPKQKEGYRYGDVSEISPCSVKSWSNNDAVSTPSSYTKSRSNGVISPLGMDSSTLNSSSFRFGCKPTFLNSIDLNCFKNSRFNELTKAEKKKKDKSSASDVGISWREGLLSRIFETGDLDSYQSFFVDDRRYDYSRDGDESLWENGSSIFEKGDGFGSYEFPAENNKIGDQMCESKVPPLCSNSIAESISTDGVLISSGDSDWTLFYKNNLFEV